MADKQQRWVSWTADLCGFAKCKFACFAAERSVWLLQAFFSGQEEEVTVKQFEGQRMEGRSEQVMGKICRPTETEQRRAGEKRTTNRKWSYNNKPYPEKCQIVFHSRKNICLRSQGRTSFGGIVEKTASSLGKMRRARCPDAGEVLCSSCWSQI